MLRDVAQRFADDPDDRALEIRREVALAPELLHVDREPALAAKIVDEPRDRRRKAESARRALAQRAHVLAHVRERRARIARRLCELLPKDLRVALECALRTLEAEHDAGELLRQAVVQLLRDALALACGRLLSHPVVARGVRELEEVLGRGGGEIHLRFGVRRDPAEDQRADDVPLRADRGQHVFRRRPRRPRRPDRSGFGAVHADGALARQRTCETVVDGVGGDRARRVRGVAARGAPDRRADSVLDP